MPHVSRPLRWTEAHRRRTQDTIAPPDREGPVPAPAGHREGSPSYDTVTARRCSTHRRAGVGVDMPRGVAVTTGVHGGTDCGGGGEDFVAAAVVAGQRSTEVGGGSGTRVDMLGGRELPTPPAPSKWTYSTVKLSYVGVEPSSTALSHAHPCPSSNTTSRFVHTRCVLGSRMR
jgi:hypothetical protein